MSISNGLLPRQIIVVVVLSLATLTGCAEDPVKIVFVPGGASHGYGMHEHRAGLLLLARSLKQQWPQLETVVADQNSWPDADILADADALVITCVFGLGQRTYEATGVGESVEEGCGPERGKDVAFPHLNQVDALVQRGLGVALIHYGVDPIPDPGAEAVIKWVGGVYDEEGGSINPDWAAEFTDFPDHPAANGLQPFSAYDEWYFNLRFVPDRKGVTPILEARPPLSTLLRKEGPSANNPDVGERVRRGDRQAVAWAYDRPSGGRGFGFTGAHYHHTYRNDNFRKAVLNGIAWVAGLEVPPGGVESATPTWEEIAANQDYEKPPNWEQQAGLDLSGSADPVYSTPPIAVDAEQPFDVEVAIPPYRYRHIYFVFESDSSSHPNGPSNGRIRWQNARFRGQSGNEAPLHEETPAHFIGPGGPQEPPARWAEPDEAMEIPAPSLLHYPVPRGATHFLAKVSFHLEGAQRTEGKRQARVHVFFAPPAEHHFRAP